MQNLNVLPDRKRKPAGETLAGREAKPTFVQGVQWRLTFSL